MEIDWDYARNADWWTLEQFCEFVCPDDPSARAKLYRLARLAIKAGTLVPKGFASGRPRFHPGIYGEPPPRRPDIFYLAPAEALAWARSKGFTIPPQLAGIESPRPADETQPSTVIAPDNEPIAKRKAPDIFVAELFRLIAAIGKRAAEKGMPFDVNEMPGTKADFRELAIRFDGSKFLKAPSTFSDYLAGLLRFKEGAQKTTFYRDLFPELFT